MKNKIQNEHLDNWLSKYPERVVQPDQELKEYFTYHNVMGAFFFLVPIIALSMGIPFWECAAVACITWNISLATIMEPDDGAAGVAAIFVGLMILIGSFFVLIL